MRPPFGIVKPPSWGPINAGMVHPIFRSLWVGKVGHWAMLEGGGNRLYDISSFKNHGTFPGGTADPTWTKGKFGKALSFDGSNDVVNVSDSPSLSIAGQMSISALINISTLPASGNWDGIIAKGGSGETASANHNYALAIENGIFGAGRAATFFFEDSSGTNYTARHSFTHTTGVWYRLVGVYDTAANTMFLYQDGIEVASTGSVTATPNTQSQVVTIGANQAGGTINYFDGLIASAMISNRAWTLAQVKLADQYPFGDITPWWWWATLGGAARLRKLITMTETRARLDVAQG